MSTRLQRRIAQARSEQRGILLGFLPAGYPSRDGFTAAAQAAFDAGLDVLEVSMPGPAPALDGPLIQEAALQAGRHMTGIDDALALAAASRLHPDDTIVAMAYAQVFETITVEHFLDALEASDIDGILIPQHPMAEQLVIGAAAQARGIEPLIFLRLQEDLTILAESAVVNPVIYLQSADLQTGGKFNSEKAAERLSELAEAFGDKPYAVCVGFGVRGFDEVKMLMTAGADGAIIGTRLVVAAGDDPALVAAIVDEVAPALVRREEVTA